MDGTLGEMRIVAFQFIPKNWDLCYGQYISIASNQALYAVIGTTYGGNGVTDFALPDFRGRVPLQHGQGTGLPNYQHGQKGGEIYHTLTEAEMPAHKHAVVANVAMTAAINSSSDDSANTDDPTNANPSLGVQMYTADTPDAVMAGAPVTVTGNVALSSTGAGERHLNTQPFIALSYVICVQGLFPSRN